MKKRFVSLLLTLAMLLPLFPAEIVAYAEEVKPEIYGSSLSLENNIAVNFVVDARAFGQNGFSLPRMTFEFRGETTEVSAYTEKSGYYYFTFRDLTAVNMGETVTATLSGVRNGARIDSDPVTESVASYCKKALFTYSTSNPALCTMVVDLLNYGTQAQIYFNHGTNKLANAILTPSQLAMGTEEAPDPVSCEDLSFQTVSAPELIWRGVNLDLAESINLQFFFDAEDVSGLTVTVRDQNGQAISSFTEADFVRAEGYWRVCCDTLTPDRMGEALSVFATRNGAAVSDTIRYSVESYAAKAAIYENDLDLDALLDAMLNYGSSAGVYAAEKNHAVKAKKPTLRSQLDAIPVATPGMTQDELRDIVLRFYELQGGIPWITREDLSYDYSAGSLRDLTANTIYCGMPYSSAGVGLYKFLDYYNEETGALNNPWGDEMGPELGNHCSSSIYWAWARISPTIKFTETKKMTAGYGLVKVGDYTIDETKTIFEDEYTSTGAPADGTYSTRTVCQDDNAPEDIYESYAQLLPADGIVSYFIDSAGKKTHHTRLVKRVYVARYLLGSNRGKINPSSSKVYFYEQDSTPKDATVNGQSVKLFSKGVTGGETYRTFSNLYSQNYIPVTCKELAHNEADRASVEAASVSLSSQVTATTFSGLKKSVRSNFPIAKVTLTAADADGNVAARVCAYQKMEVRFYNLSTLVNSLDAELKKGTYTVTVTALLGNGETVTPYSGTVVKS